MFDDTLKSINSDVKFSLIHIDSDFYASALSVLDYLLDNKQVSEGATILFDDFNCHRASNDLGERRAWNEISKKYKIVNSDMGYYGAFGWKCIIHSYSC